MNELKNGLKMYVLKNNKTGLFYNFESSHYFETRKIWIDKWWFAKKIVSLSKAKTWRDALNKKGAEIEIQTYKNSELVAIEDDLWKIEK